MDFTLQNRITNLQSILILSTAVVSVVLWYSSLILDATTVFDDTENTLVILLVYGYVIAFGVGVGEFLLRTRVQERTETPESHWCLGEKPLADYRLVQRLRRVVEVRGERRRTGVSGFPARRYCRGVERQSLVLGRVAESGGVTL